MAIVVMLWRAALSQPTSLMLLIGFCPIQRLALNPQMLRHLC